MKRTLIVMVLMSVVAGPASAQRPRLSGPEAPRATDLLRAETLAEQAERRLKTRAPRGPAWRHGGAGGEGAIGAPPAAARGPFLHPHPSPRRAAPPRPPAGLPPPPFRGRAPRGSWNPHSARPPPL